MARRYRFAWVLELHIEYTGFLRSILLNVFFRFGERIGQ